MADFGQKFLTNFGQPKLTPTQTHIRLWGRRGFTRQPENQTCTFQGPGPSKTPPKFHEKTPQRDRKRAKWWRERETKRANFWAPHPSGPHPSGPHPSGPRRVFVFHFFFFFSSSCCSVFFEKEVGLAKVGISRLGVSPSDFSANHTRSCMMWPESPPRFRSLWVVWDSLPQPGRGRGLTWQVGLIASQWCTSVTPQPQRPWCKGWSGTHYCVLRPSERVAHLTEAGFEVPVDSVEGQHRCCPSRLPRTQRAQVWVQHKATRCVHQPQRALMRSQHGPLVSAPLTAVPTTRMTRIEGQPFVFSCYDTSDCPFP